jgi:hypothetical protein
VNHRKRTHGKSHYGITRTFRVILDLMTVKFLSSYSTRPLQMFGSVGMILNLFGFLAGARVVYERFFGYQSANRPLLFVSIALILGGMQFLATGLVAELMARTYHESQDKPTYVIKEIRETPPVRGELISA